MSETEKPWEVICGDCVEVMRGMPDDSVDVVVTDPPYGVGLDYDGFDDSRENVQSLAELWLPEAIRVSRGPVAFTPGVTGAWDYPKPSWVLSWVNSGGGASCPWGFDMHRPILVYGRCPYLASGMGRRPSAHITNCVERKPTWHPCPKPLHIMRWLLDRVDPTGKCSVLDPFCGSGSTGVAAVESGRTFVGIEMSEKYCGASRDRLSGCQMPLAFG